MLNESNYHRKSDAILIEADFSNDSLFSNDILNKFEEDISEWSNPGDVLSNVICTYNVFVSGEILGQCEAVNANVITVRMISHQMFILTI